MKKILTSLLIVCSQMVMASEPIAVSVQSSPGGFTDVTTRLVAEPLSKVLGVPVVVESRPGANGTVAMAHVATAKTDGLTLLAGHSMFHTALPHMVSKFPYDPITTFAPVGLMAIAETIIVVNSSVPVNNIKELIAYTKANPDKVNYASAGYGSGPHIAAEVFMLQSKSQMVHIPYKGTTSAIPDLVSNKVQVMFTTLPSVQGFIKSGKLKALAITGAARSGSLPEVPTTKEAGMPEFQVSTWMGLFAPVGTPPAVIQKYNDALKVVLTDKTVITRGEQQGLDMTYSTPNELDKRVRGEYNYWRDVIKTLDIKIDK